MILSETKLLFCGQKKDFNFRANKPFVRLIVPLNSSFISEQEPKALFFLMG